MKFKKKYFGIDFMGNKIKNVKVDTPTNSEDITNKSYVDEKSLFNTTKAQTFNNSEKFPWVQNIFNVSLKTVLDKLLFPVIEPSYKDPTFEYVKFNIYENNNFSTNNKVMIHKGMTTSCVISYKINSVSDRISTSTPYVKITYTDGTNVIINADNTDLESQIKFDLEHNDNILSIDLLRNYNAVLPSSYKLDNYGNQYIPTHITLPYKLNYDILNFINKNMIVTNPILIYKINQNYGNFITVINDIPGNTEISDFSIGLMHNSIVNFSKTNNTYLTTDTDNYLIIGLPDDLYNFYEMNVEIPKFLNNPIPKNVFNKTKTLLNHSNPVKYNFCLLNVGYPQQEQQILLYFNKLRHSF